MKDMSLNIARHTLHTDTYPIVYPRMVGRSQVLVDAKELDVCHEVRRIRSGLRVVKEAKRRWKSYPPPTPASDVE